MHARISLLCATALLACGTASAETKVDPPVEQRLAEDNTVRVIVVTRPDPEIPGGGQAMTAPQAYVAERLGLPADSVRPIGTMRAVSAEITAQQLERLRSDPNVEAVMADIPVPPSTDFTIGMIGADQVHARGFRGTNLSVAILDTGLDKTHPAFANSVAAEACFSTTTAGTHPSRTLCPNGLDMSLLAGAAANCPQSVRGCDHGTHVAGIVAGRPITQASHRYSGVSPAARVVPIQVFSLFSNPADCRGVAPCVLSYPSDQLRALEWVLKKHQLYRIASVNMSLGGGYFDHPCDTESALTETIERLRTKGVLTVIAAGNNAFYDGVSMPGCISSAITVAGTTKAGAIDVSYSNVAPFVDVAAPGTAILSAVPGGIYQPKTGTSMAAPHVAGSLALLREEYPGASAAELEAKLKGGVPGVTDARTGTQVARLEVARTLPMAGNGMNALAAVDADVPAATMSPVAAAPIEQSFIIRAGDGEERLASSIENACSGESCELKRISDSSWKLDIPVGSVLVREKGSISPADIREAIPALPADAKIFANTPAAPM